MTTETFRSPGGRFEVNLCEQYDVHGRHIDATFTKRTRTHDRTTTSRFALWKQARAAAKKFIRK